jgi:hypothetical protein
LGLSEAPMTAAEKLKSNAMPKIDVTNRFIDNLRSGSQPGIS